MYFNHLCDPQKSDMNGALIMNKATNSLKCPQKKRVCMQIFSIQIKKKILGRSHYSWNMRTKMYLHHQRQISNDYIPRMEMEKVQDEMNNLVFPVSH